MSHVSKCRLCKFYKWTVEIPFEGLKRYSPTFQYNNNQFQFEISLTSLIYRVRLVYVTVGNRSQFRCDLPIVIRIYIENRTGYQLFPQSVLSQNSHEKHLFRIYSAKCWDCRVSDILNIIPDLYTKGLLTYMIEFDSPHGSITCLVEPTTTAVPALTEKAVQTATWEPVQCLRDLSDDLAKLLKGKSAWKPDVTLICKDRKLMAHGLVLSTRSEVFAAMLRNDMSEKCSGIVNVQDMDPDDFEDFVRYLYTGKLPDLPSVDFAKRLYVAADRYAMGGLSRLCMTFLKQNMSPEDACELLTLADAHSDANLKEFASDYILEKKVYLQDDLWLPFCQRHSLLAIEVLNRTRK